MILTGAAIRTSGLIKEGYADHYREASYDLTVGKLVSPAGDLVDAYTIPPQGIVKVVSAETVSVSDELVAFVSVKTSLCNEGLLSLNIGIVDPGYEGPLQSSILNFGKSTFCLEAGDVFCRITFHRLNERTKIEVKPPVSLAQAHKDARKQVMRFLSGTFMDIAATADEAARKTFAKYKTTLFIWIPVVALFLTMLTFALNFGNMWLLQSYSKPQDQVRTELLSQALEKRLGALEQERDQEANELRLLRSQIAKQSVTSPAHKSEK